MSLPNQPIYLDNHATTPVDPRVIQAMRPFWEAQFANPASAEHAMGRVVAEAVEAARDHIAELIGASAAALPSVAHDAAVIGQRADQRMLVQPRQRELLRGLAIQQFAPKSTKTGTLISWMSPS